MAKYFVALLAFLPSVMAISPCACPVGATTSFHYLKWNTDNSDPNDANPPEAYSFSTAYDTNANNGAYCLAEPKVTFTGGDIFGPGGTFHNLIEVHGQNTSPESIGIGEAYVGLIGAAAQHCFFFEDGTAHKAGQGCIPGDLDTMGNCPAFVVFDQYDAAGRNQGISNVQVGVTCCSEPHSPGECGDGTVDPGEDCDDGNTVDGDGCAADCTAEPFFCGDGNVDPGEECDDNNNLNNDGCAADCTIEAFCGDGNVDPELGEECDDNNNTDGDGCTADCTIEDNEGGGGGDPHFKRWGQERSTFHGECDLVLVHSEQFNNGAGLDLHMRSSIDSYFSYFEAAALRLGDFNLEIHQESFYLNGVKLNADALPLAFGDYTMTLGNLQGENRVSYNVDLGNGGIVAFKFHKKFLTFTIKGGFKDFGDSVGMLGDYRTGEMYGRDGQVFTNFESFGFEWQVNPEDPKLFIQDRAPQLPYEMCRMPSAARPARNLRANKRLLEEAQSACSHVASKNDGELCINDVLMTEDVGLADLW